MAWQRPLLRAAEGWLGLGSRESIMFLLPKTSLTPSNLELGDFNSRATLLDKPRSKNCRSRTVPFSFKRRPTKNPDAFQRRGKVTSGLRSPQSLVTLGDRSGQAASFRSALLRHFASKCVRAFFPSLTAVAALSKKTGERSIGPALHAQ